MKAYVKPELFYESFVLSQHIAACGIDVGFGKVGTDDNGNVCQPQLDPDFWGGETDKVFGNSALPSCQTDISAIEVYCYTVGTNEAGKLFNS